MSFCPVHPWLSGFSKKERRRVTPFSATIPRPRPFLLSPLSLQLWSSLAAGGPQEVAAYPGEGSSDVSASKTAQVSPLLLGFPSPQLQETRQEGWCAAAQPPRLWLCGATPNPGRQRGGGGFSEGRAWGEEADRRMKGRWIPGKTKALRDLRIPDKPRGKPPWLLAV